MATAFAPDNKEIVKFEALSDVITHVGIIELKQDWRIRKKGEIEVNVISSPKILKWACYRGPEVFSRFPVRYLDESGSFKTIRVRCET